MGTENSIPEENYSESSVSKEQRPLDSLSSVPLPLLGEFLSSSDFARQYIDDIEKFKNLSDLLVEHATELRSKLGVDYVILNEHFWEADCANTLADSAVQGFASRSNHPHKLSVFEPLLRLAGSPEGIELALKLNLSPSPNQICIEDLELFEEHPSLKGFREAWPWKADRALAFTPLVFGEFPFPGAIACIHSRPRAWPKTDCAAMLDAAKQISRAISKERALDRVVGQLQMRVNEYFRLFLPGNEELTNGELRVLAVLMKDGSENKEIAEQIGSTERAVKKHLLNMLEKTSCKNRTQLALWGQERVREAES
ncbi:helix-turn-helix transcriptional regulator [Gloeobacter morelensis]|uniref:helix-turn-helix transcriptional regulator n=1 Tax=Gloeobacter morelensis TaxID=2907343 RepID=UPI001E6264D9|nr:LuxR C-terminal-related transcriptional regulator [Gloeobacter morelensis]UFP97155.1 response regulator transcription factor [Gloeobacter morelensis MG652769]